MKQLNTLTALACGFLLSWPSVGQAQQAGVLTVEVFANSAMHITPAQTSGLPFKMDLYRLDAMQNAEHQINQVLPKTEAEAMAWIKANEARLRKQLQPAVVNSANRWGCQFHPERSAALGARILKNFLELPA